MKLFILPKNSIPLVERSSFRIVIAALIILVGVILLTIFIYTQLESSMIELRRQELKRLVTLGLEAVNPIIAEYEQNKKSRQEALRDVRTIVRRFVYDDPTTKNYLFMSAYDGTMLVQPFEPEKEGTSQWDLVDAHGTYIIRELVRTAQQGSGYVTYSYPSPGSKNKPQTKISYVVGIDPLGCYVGTGMYIEDIQATALSMLTKVFVIQFLISTVIIVAAIAFFYPFLHIYRLLVGHFYQIALNPDNIAPIPISKYREKSEIWYIVSGFKSMLERLEESRNTLKENARKLEEEIEERQRTESVLQKERKIMSLLIDNLPGYVILKDTNSRYITANRMYCEYKGIPLEELIGKSDYDLFPRERADLFRKEDEMVIATGEILFCGEEVITDNNRRVVNSKKKVPLKDENGNVIGIIALAFDVTTLKDNEEKIAASLHEKEVLLKEIHHRVKNNLQIISSLLSLQADMVGDEAYSMLIRESMNRISSMAQVHEMLYETSNFAKIEFSHYISRITANITSSYGISPARIHIELDVDPVEINPDTAVTGGLIITELLTNAMKYAFPDDRKGTIRVALKKRENILLEVRDTGIGFPAEVLEKRSSTLGLVLVRSLVSQLGGTVDFANSDGAVCTITFALKA